MIISFENGILLTTVIWILLIVLFRGNEKDSHGVYFTVLLQIPYLSIENLFTLTTHATVPTAIKFGLESG